MAQSGVYGILLLVAFVFANLPWLTDRFMLIVKTEKGALGRWTEWLSWYALTGTVMVAVEKTMTGTVHLQQWEFYVATLCLFAVFALPGFIYHYDLKKLLKG